VRQLPRPDGSKPLPFKLQIKGEIPLEHLRHFVALDLRRHGQELQLEGFEVIAPVVQRGNRGGKKSGRSGSAGGGGRGASRPGEGRGGEGRGSAGRAGRGNASDSSRVNSSRVDSSRVERPIKRGDAAARDGAAGGSAAKETEAAGAGVSHRLTGLRNAISRPAR
jgi:hypothetical protein